MLVASDADRLERDEGGLWDSGRVASSETIEIAYAGRALASFQHACWKVMVWDQDGAASEWSAPARFAMGALAPGDWRASWIGFDAPRRAVQRTPDLEGSAWLRTQGGARELWLRHRFDLPALDASKAVLVLAAADEYEVYLNGAALVRKAHADGARRYVEVIKLGAHLRAGENLLALHVRRARAAPAALAAKLYLRPGSDEPHELPSEPGWRVSARAAGGFELPGFDDAAWEAAVALSAREEKELPPLDLPSLELPPPRLLRGEFRTRAAPVRATLYASALGSYSLELNGARVGEDWFAPGWTDYTRRVPYRAHDVTALVRAGENVLGAVLADGWYAGFLGKRGKRDNYGSRTRFLAQLVLEQADGGRELVVTDGTWRASTGPWLEADLYMGERYDARAELPGWSAPGFDARAWQPVDVGTSAAPPLSAHAGPPIEVIREFAPVSVTPRPDGVAIYDFGQEIAGVVRLAITAPAGSNVLLRFGERLEADGSLWRRNLGWARSTDLYIARGGGPETWQPRFTYHGFRYVELSGLPSPAENAELTALALSSATRDAGTFECSDPLLNRMIESARWTLRANSMDVPTDCPQRGERLGWTGDAQLFAPSALWLADLSTLYAKWCLDLADAQRADGGLPSIVPGWPGLEDGGPAWSDACVLVPARLFGVTGDQRIVERMRETMRRFVAGYERRAGPDLAPPEEFACYGDWNALDPGTPEELLYQAYFARSVQKLAELERALGNAAEAARLEALRERLRAAFARDFVDGEGRVRGGTQAAYALALAEGLVPDPLCEKAGAHLLGDLERCGGPSTGFVGTPELLPALTSLGRAADAYRLLRRREYPSWGYMLEHGGTTLWERWDAWTPERGFANDGFVSFAHTPFGSPVAWLFETAAGIRPAEPGFKSVTLAPVPGGGLEWAEASYDSVRGKIALRWELAGDELHLSVSLPPNVPATLAVPTRSPDSVREAARSLAESPGVRELSRPPGRLLLQLAPGHYTFTAR